MKRAEEEFGESSLNFAATQYEYGYALFLDKTRDEINNDNEGSGRTSVTKKSATEDSPDDIMNEDDQQDIALEHMVKACTLLYEYVNKTKDTSNTPRDSLNSDNTSPSEENAIHCSYLSWASEQLSRYLVGIGYVLSYQGKHADALSSYFNALPFRLEMQEHAKDSAEKFKAHRVLVEAYVLIVEEILKCPRDKNIETESNELLMKKEERIEIAKIHYEKARDELQEA